MNIYNEEFCREHKISTLTKLFLVLIGTAENSEPFFMQKKKKCKAWSRMECSETRSRPTATDRLLLFWDSSTKLGRVLSN